MTVCYDGVWYPKIHSCQRSCKAIDLNTLDLECTYKGQAVSCVDDVRVGTQAAIACKQGFITDRNYEMRNHCLKTGKWKYVMYDCAPICGVTEKGNEELVDSTESIDAVKAPWNAAIYLADNATFTLMCGGALISEQFILTAAKCVKDEKGSLRSASSLRVALAKTYRDWNDPRDAGKTQRFELQGITSDDVFEEFFKGGSEMISFVKNLAVLRLKGMVDFCTFVKPICIDLARLNERVPDLIGTVVGWNLNKDSSTHLTRFLRPIENHAVCKTKVYSPENVDNPNKFCTERMDELVNYHGAGITFKDTVTDTHYVIGILTDHLANITVFLGYRDESSAMIVDLMRFYFEKAKNVKSVQ
ncbi:modular serine protease isoform X3 [Nilaparvata lugens]|nr:modular serine protease isoform X3 [Nilaparvata lugens]XP_039281800.1 modular serine protease isoform X3 [Nilaparvata lugens]